MSADQQVFVLSTEGRDTGTPDNGSISVGFGALSFTSPFCLTLTSFNTVFLAPNISATRGNTIQADNGTVTVTAVLPTGSYSIDSSNDIEYATVKALNAAFTAAGLASTIFTSNFDNATNHYTFKCTYPFRFIFGSSSYAAQLGFDPSLTLALNLSHTGTKAPKFYENYITINIRANNAETQLVKIPQPRNNTRSCSLGIPRTADYSQQLYLTKNEIAEQTMCFSRCPSVLEWTLTRPNGMPLEQEADWTAVFSVSKTY